MRTAAKGSFARPATTTRGLLVFIGNLGGSVKVTVGGARSRVTTRRMLAILPPASVALTHIRFSPCESVYPLGNETARPLTRTVTPDSTSPTIWIPARLVNELLRGERMIRNGGFV